VAVAFRNMIRKKLADLNMIHPFREGNGRSIREFIRELALKNDFIINWSLIEKETLLEAMIIAVEKDLEPLNKCILQVTENK
jgi:cell filamentation protein